MDVRDDHARFTAAGAKVVVVTMANIPQAAAFQQRHALPFPVLADPGQTAYRAYHVPRGTLWSIAGPPMWWRAIKSLIRHGAGKPTGDVRQMPGSFVIGRGGIVLLVHAPRHSGDNPTNDELLAPLSPQ